MFTARVSRQPQKVLILSFAYVCIVSLMTIATTPHMAVATASYCLLLIGLWVRRTDRTVHAGSMIAGILVDVSLVLILQMQRSAVQTMASFTLTPWQQVHVFTSFGAILLYIPTLYMGTQMLRNPETRTRWRGPHLRVALVAFILRTIGFLTMFSMLGKQ